MIGDLRAELRPQREWGEGRGAFLVIGHFLVGVAAGAWLMGLIFISPAALAFAVVLGLLGAAAHLLFLGHPERVWRMASRVRTSWVSRGLLGLGLFLAGAIVYLLPWLSDRTPWSDGSFLSVVGYVIALSGTLILIGYMGFVYAASKGIPFWNSRLHPVLYMGQALRGGVAVMLFLAAFDAHFSGATGELIMGWMLITAAVVLFFMAELYGAWRRGNAAARRSVQELLGGRAALPFYGGAILLGVAMPAWWAAGIVGSSLSPGALASMGIASALGDFFFKYATQRAGIHLPVWTAPSPKR